MMQKKILLILTLILHVISLKNIPIQPNKGNADYFGQLQYLRIMQDEIFYILRDHSKFGYINKNDGKINMVVQLQQDKKHEKFIGVNQYFFRLLQGNKIKNFDIHQKRIRFDKPFYRMKNITYDKIKSVIDYHPYQYILTDDTVLKIRFVNGTYEDLNVFYSKGSSDSLKSQQFNNLLLVTQKISKNLSTRKQNNNQKNQILALIFLVKNKGLQQSQVCISLFQNQKSKSKNCFSIGRQTLEKAQCKGGSIYLITKQNTFIIDQGLKLKTKINKKPRSISNGVVVFEGGSSFLSSSSSIQDQLIFESEQNKVYKLVSKQSGISLIQAEKNLAQLPKQNDKNPINFWVKQTQLQIQDNIMEILIQWSDVSISYYKIKQGDNKSLKQIWRINKK